MYSIQRTLFRSTDVVFPGGCWPLENPKFECRTRVSLREAGHFSGWPAIVSFRHQSGGNWKTGVRSHQRRTRKLKKFAVEASGGDGMGKEEREESTQLYGKIERMFAESARRSQGTGGEGGEWEELEGAWVLTPPDRAPRAIVHFIGGAFVGASPQLTYRLFLERLSNRGLLVIATPYRSGFDHLRIADEAQFKFDRCLRKLMLSDPQIERLPVFGIGHSLGALTHLLIGARYAVQRVGNVLISFNNKEASKAIPLLSPVLLPAAQNFGPLISQITSSSTFTLGTDMALRQLQGLNSPLVKQILPLLEQLPPLVQDLTRGKDAFTPAPLETRRLVQQFYSVRRNMLIRFRDDSIDETLVLADTLGRGSAVSAVLDLALRTLPGDHARPLQQVVPEMPRAVADAVTQGGALFASLTAGTPLGDLARGVNQSLGSDLGAQQYRQGLIDDMELLVDEIAPWMGGLQRPDAKNVYWLPSR